jgi:histidine triad (HIT) family protein
MTDCIFCRIVSGQIPSKRVFEDAEVVVFEDVNPAAPTHVLVVPRRHIPTLDDTREEDAGLLGHLTRVAQRVAAERGLSDGYRLVMNVQAGAGQSVFHIHLHVLGGRRLGWPPG